MKITFTFLVLFNFFSASLFCQESPLSEQPEFYTRTKNIDEATTITFTLKPLAYTYCHTGGENPIWLSHCQNCDYEPTVNVTGPNETGPTQQTGFEFCYSGGTTWPVFGFTIYKVKVVGDGNSKYFYLELRDCDFTTKYATISGPDMFMRYDGAGNGKLEYKATSSVAYEEVYNGQIIRIWEEYNQSSAHTEDFANFWQNCLAGLKDEANPKFVWGKHPTMSGITGYNIYRAGGTSGGVFFNNTFSLLADIEDDVFDYEDDNAEVTYGSNFVALYRVKAEISSSESSATNTVIFHYNMAWSNSLVLYPSTSNNPILAWQKHPTMNNVSSYRIYRAVTTAGSPPPSPLLYSLIASVNENTFEWKDPDFTLGGSSNTAYWFVKAYNGSYSSATNTVSTNVLYYDKSKTEQVYTIEKTSTFELITQ